jgi:hypothetical protein
VKAYDSARKEELYNILNEFVIPMELVRLINMCLNEPYSRILVDKHIADILFTRNFFLNKEMFYLN